MKQTEHEKLEKFSKEKRQIIYEFIEYCERVGFNGVDLEDAFYDMLGIDHNEIKKEREKALRKSKDISLNL